MSGGNTAHPEPVEGRAGTGALRDPVLGVTALFIDDGGVLNNNAVRSAQWQRLVAEFLCPILGGNQALWAEANRVVMERLVPFLTQAPQWQDFSTWWDEYQKQWLRGMATLVGVSAPLDDAECVRLAKEASVYVTHRVRSAYPGAAEAAQVLHTRGFDLFTASGEVSWELDGYLTGMRVRDHFRILYGPDLINWGKWPEGAEYYRRAFAHAGVDPKRTLVVDDSAAALTQARRAGAKTCLIGTASPKEEGIDLVVSRLADVPSALEDSS